MGASPRPVALLVNNLGGTPAMELYVVAHNARQCLEKRGMAVARTLVGPAMTSLEMAGVSLSVLPLEDPLVLARLDAPTEAPAWPKPATTGQRPEVQPKTAPGGAAAADTAASSGGGSSGGAPAVPAVVLVAACAALEAAEPQLTQWDQVAGDGDCGITFQRGAKAVGALAAAGAPAGAAACYRALADAVAGSMGGTSGALLEIFFRAGAVHLLQQPAGGGTDHGGAFVKGAEAIATIGGAEAGMRTMLDALLPAAAKLRGVDPADGAATAAAWAAAVEAAEAGAEATLSMSALAGRSNYISAELLATVPDPGAKAVAIAMRAAYEASN